MGAAKRSKLYFANWDCTNYDDLLQKITWLKAIPTLNNGLTFNGKALTNWWSFIGEFDAAMKAKPKLTVE